MAEDSGTGAPMTDAALNEIRTRWLSQCGPCDAGLPMACTHPNADYRNPMADLLAEVDRLRAELAEATKPGKWYPPRDDMTLTGGSFTSYPVQTSPPVSILPPEYSRTSAPRLTASEHTA